MMGFAGQLSLGHAHLCRTRRLCRGDPVHAVRHRPWIGLLAAIPFAAACGAIDRLSRLPLRRRRRLFRDSDHRVCRVRADRLRSSGFRQRHRRPVPAGQAIRARRSVAALRGDPAMFYYVILAATVLVFGLCHFLLRSRVGYFWRAIREDEIAARAAGIDTFRYKMYAVMVSAGITSFAGVFYAFFYNNLFPEQVFGISPFDRDHSRPDHRRRWHAVRPDPRRVRADRPRRGAQRGDGGTRHRSAGCHAGVLRPVPARGRGWHCQRACGRRSRAVSASGRTRP